MIFLSELLLERFWGLRIKTGFFLSGKRVFGFFLLKFFMGNSLLFNSFGHFVFRVYSNVVIQAKRGEI